VSELARLRANRAQQSLTTNDLSDISALTGAIVHCDVVVTKNQWTALIKSAPASMSASERRS
jgi:hypothetical protein